jgi:CHASE2 domain-containing sensor protein
VVLPVLLERGPTGAPVEALPIPSLTSAAAALGHVDLEPDADGRTRTMYLRAGVGRAHWLALPLAGQLVADGQGPADAPGTIDGAIPERPSGGLAWVRDERVLVPFSGGAGHYEQASYVDVLRGRFPADRIRGTTMVVGVTAQGLSANVVTPLTDASSPMSGAELVASVFDAVRSHRTLRYMGLEATALLTRTLAVLATVVATVFTPALGAVSGVVLPLAAAAILLAIAGRVVHNR